MRMLVFTTTNPSAAGEKRGDGENRLEKSETKKKKKKTKRKKPGLALHDGYSALHQRDLS